MSPGSPSPDADVVVVGGGIAGLAAAYDLERGGLRVTLCEASTRLGGLILTEEVSGCVVEAGPDSMLAQKPAALGLCRELGLDNLIIGTLEPRTAFVLRDDVLHPISSESVLGLPVTSDAIDRSRMLSAAGRASFERDLTAPSTARPVTTDESIGAFIRRRFDDEAVRVLAQPLLGGIHAGDVERLSVRALFPMLANADVPGTSLLKTLASHREGRSLEGAFRSLRRGMSALVSRLAAEIPRTNIRLGTVVSRVEAGRQFTVETSAGRLIASSVIVAVPAWQAARLIESLDADLADACAGIPYASSATITLAYAKESVTRELAGTGFVVPRNERATRLLAASWLTSKWAGRAPEDLVLIRAFAGGTLDRDLLELDDDELAVLAHRDLARLLEIRARPLFARTYRWRDAGAQYEVGHTSRVAAIEAGAARWPGLWLTGSAFRGVGIPDCVADARAIAARVIGSFARRA
jgi:protoporphyrinogen/coproporphyrinogen III oxidase